MKVFSPGLAVTTALTYALLFRSRAARVWPDRLLWWPMIRDCKKCYGTTPLDSSKMVTTKRPSKSLKRAAHLSRVNDGLDAKSQLPFVRARNCKPSGAQPIRSGRRTSTPTCHELKPAQSPQAPKKITALLRQAEWHQFALLEDIDEDEEATARMGKAWNFYRRALNESIATYGEDSAELFPALEGMVRAQYLLAGHRGIGASMPGRMDRERRDFAAGKSTFKRGLSVLVAMQQLNRDRLRRNARNTGPRLDSNRRLGVVDRQPKLRLKLLQHGTGARKTGSHWRRSGQRDVAVDRGRRVCRP